MTNHKLYYGIKEVADLLHVEQSKLRFWDKVFADLIVIRRSPTQRRQYTQSDIELLKTIQHLIDVDGLKLAGVKQRLSKNTSGETKRAEAVEHLLNAKRQLSELRKLLARPYDMDDIRVRYGIVETPPEDAQAWQLNDDSNTSSEIQSSSKLQDKTTTSPSLPSETGNEIQQNREELPSLFGDAVKVSIPAPVKKKQEIQTETEETISEKNNDDKRQLSLFS